MNNALNTFNWAIVDTYPDVQDYEYSLDNGQNWLPATAKPQTVADIDIPAGFLLVRVSENTSIGRPQGLSTQSSEAMTKTPTKPAAPILQQVDDATNLINWHWVDGYLSPTDYEINTGSGWANITALPFRVGNTTIPAGTISIRVKSNASDARPFGHALVIETEFTESANQPVAPTIPVVDDANNTFSWTFVAGYSDLNQYEYSLDNGLSFRSVTATPNRLRMKTIRLGKYVFGSNLIPTHNIVLVKSSVLSRFIRSHPQRQAHRLILLIMTH